MANTTTTPWGMASPAAPTAQATVAQATPAPTKVASTPLTVDQQALSANQNVAAGQTGSPWVTPTTSASTTTISNVNKQQQVPAIQQTTQNLAQGGLTSNPTGTVTYANGEIYTPPVTPSPLTQSTQSKTTNSNVDASGNSTIAGYNNGVYYAVGSYVPKDATGNPVTLTATDPVDDQIMASLNQQKTQADTQTTQLISNIQAQYANLIEQQKIINSSQAAGANNNRLIGGATGQGSAAQFASQTSNSIFTSVLNQGIQAISNLQAKENDAVLQAQIAGQNQDFQLQDKLNQQAQDIRDKKQQVASKINDQLASKNEATTQKNIDSSRDSAIAGLYQQGITDPSQMLNYLNFDENDNRIGDFTSKEVVDALNNLKPSLDEQKFENDKQEAAKNFAINNQITKPFFLIGNTAVATYDIGDIKAGQKVDLATYQRLTGQTVGSPESKTDFSHIQTDIKTPDQQKIDLDQQKFAEDQLEFQKNYSLDERKELASESAAGNVKKSLVKINGTDYLVDENGNLTDPKVPQTQVSETKTNALKTAKDILTDLDNGKGNLGVLRLTGAQKIPGTTAYKFDVNVNNLKSLLSLDNVKLLKGQGQISDAERRLLEQATSKLDEGLSSGDFRSALNDVITSLSGSTVTNLDDYVKQNPDKIDTVERILNDNPDLEDSDVLDILNGGGGLNNVGGDTNKAISIKPLSYNFGSSYAQKNNNPGNLKFVGQIGATQGLGGFAKFPTPEAGIQALASQVKLDASRGHTLASFINKYAPPSENDTKLYIKQLSQWLGVSPETKISSIDNKELVKALAKKESSSNITFA